MFMADASSMGLFYFMTSPYLFSSMVDISHELLTKENSEALLLENNGLDIGAC